MGLESVTVRREIEREGWKEFPGLFPIWARTAALDFLDNAAVHPETFPQLEPEFEEPDEEGGRVVRKLRRILWSDEGFWVDLLTRSGVFETGAALVSGQPVVVFHAAFLKSGRVGSEVPYHQDQALWSYDYPGAASLWIALTSVGPKNGGLSICPKSHSGGLIPHRDDPGHPRHESLDPAEHGLEPVHLRLRPGDAVAWARYTVHGSGENRSLDARKGMVIVFADAAAPGFEAKEFYRLPVD